MVEVIEETVKVTHLPGCRLEAVIQLDADEVAVAKKAAIREVSKGVSIPGFRKGRVPEDLVVQHFASGVEKELRKQLSLKAWEKLAQVERVRPLRNGIQGKIQKADVSGAEVHYRVDHEPTVPEVNLEGLKLPQVEMPEVTDEEIEKFLKQIGRWMGGTEDAELIADGTAVSLELAWTDGKEPEVFAQKESTPVDQLPTWMVTALMGKKAGEVAEIAWGDTPIDDGNLVPQGRPCRITVIRVQKLLDHVIDDELAKKVGAENVEKLRERVRERIAVDKRREVHKQRRQLLRDQLLEQMQFEVPGSVVEATMGNVRDEQAKANQSEEFEKRKDEVNKEVVEGVRLAYLAESILRQFHQSVQYQDVLAKVQEMSPPWADHQKLMRDLLEDEQANARLTSTVMVEKALDCLLARLEHRA